MCQECRLSVNEPMESAVEATTARTECHGCTHVCSIEAVGLLLGDLLVDDFACSRGRLMLASGYAGCARCDRRRESASRIDRVCDDGRRLFVVVGHGLQERWKQSRGVAISFLLFSSHVWPSIPGCALRPVAALVFFPLRWKRAAGNNGGREDGHRAGKSRVQHVHSLNGISHLHPPCSLCPLLFESFSLTDSCFGLYSNRVAKRASEIGGEEKEGRQKRKSCSTNKQQSCPSRNRLLSWICRCFDDEERSGEGERKAKKKSKGRKGTPENYFIYLKACFRLFLTFFLDCAGFPLACTLQPQR